MLNLKDDGTAEIQIGEETYSLKRPTIGEYRKIREYARTLDSQRSETAGEDPEGASLSKLDQDFVAYHRIIFEVLGDKVLPESNDDLPLWFASAELSTSLLPHWRHVPLVPSSNPLPGQ